MALLDIMGDRVADVGARASIVVGLAPRSELLSETLELVVRLLVANRVASDRISVSVRVLARGKGAVAANVAGVDAVAAIPENNGRDDVEETKGDCQNARGENETPERKANSLDRVGGHRDSPENVATHDDHGDSQPAEAMLGRKGRPVAHEVGAEDVELGDDEEDGEAEGEEAGGRIEEGKVALENGHDDHGPGGGADSQEADDVERSEDVEDQVTRATKAGVFREVEHFLIVIGEQQLRRFRVSEVVVCV